MKTVPRDRVVVFRLSQEEYHSLKKACAACGARNLSDFTRGELLAVLPAAETHDRAQFHVGYLQQQVTALQDAMAHLIELLENVVEPDKPAVNQPAGETDSV